MMMHSHRLHPPRLIKNTKPLFVIQLGAKSGGTQRRICCSSREKNKIWLQRFLEKQTAGFDQYFTIARYSLRGGQSLFT